ncbi:UDP-glucose 4-epimerase GalE [Bdellovibrio sp. HCB209]|uniref:UDP-glucose 4-epimerase GalE n=1 Tax=Bdellovibrio sp. HCB209 TaxID=3394354 RepID=UPI0039B59D9C
MRVLLTGGAGYIGSHTAAMLLDKGHAVVVYDNLSTGFQEAIPKGVDFVFGDVLDRTLMAETLKKFNIDSVIHFAAKSVVPESIEKPVEYYACNTGGMLSLLQACKEASVTNVVFSSTAAVYGDGAGVFSETSSTSPLNPYGMSKLMAEKILQDSGKSGDLKYMILRYFNVAGAQVGGGNGQRTKSATHLVKVAVEAACHKRESVSIFGSDYATIDGTGVRDYIHVEDLAELHILALSHLSKGGKSDIINCGYGVGFSVRQVLNAVKKVSKSDFQIIESSRRMGDVGMVIADCSKVKNLFAWVPQRNNLELICETAYKWEQGLEN